MNRLTIAQAAEQFNVSKEAIHNRIRRGTLDCIIENGIKYIVLEAPKETQSQEVSQEPFHDKRYYQYIEEENQKLKAKIELLENENRVLRDEKIAMLENEKNTIETIYKERDEQLKNVLNVMSNKLLTQSDNIEEVEEVEVCEIAQEQIRERVPLKKYLKSYNFSKKKFAKKINNFKKIAKKDSRITLEGDKIYLQPSLHDYSDLL